MEKLHYVPAVKMNARLEEIKVSGYHISIGDYTYERVSRRPIGRSVFRKLFNTESEEQIIIYN